MVIILVKCKCHGNKIDRDTAYKVIVKDKNHYYCSEKDYLSIQEEKDSRKVCFDIINNIFGYTVTNTMLNKELSEISKTHTYKKIRLYLMDNQKFLEKTMTKEFSSEYGKIRYFSAILKNNLSDYKPKEIEPVKQINEEEIETKYKPKERKKSFQDYLAEME